MTIPETIAVTGRIADVFAHRFTLRGEDGTLYLADLGPKGAEAFGLRPGLDVTLEGERRPSEIKVVRIAGTGGAAVTIAHKPKKPRGPDHDEAEPRDALKAVATAGLAPVGAPRRKPKHFEVLARRGEGFVECHVEFDGRIRKQKPVAPDEGKWSDEIATAA